MSRYLVTFSASVEADNEQDAIELADQGKGGGHWEARPIEEVTKGASEVRKIETREELEALARELGVRPDWHEPDEQGLTAIVFGQSFDNAGFWPKSVAPGLEDVAQEMHVVLYDTEWNDSGNISSREPIATVNLATLFAWATKPLGAIPMR